MMDDDGDGWLMIGDGCLMMDCIRGHCVKDIWCKVIQKKLLLDAPFPLRSVTASLFPWRFRGSSFCSSPPSSREEQRGSSEPGSGHIGVFLKPLCSFAVSLYVPAVRDWWSLVPLFCPLWGCASVQCDTVLPCRGVSVCFTGDVNG